MEGKQTHDDPHMKGAEDSLAASLLCLVQPPRNEGSRMKAKLFLLLEAALVQPRLRKHIVVYNTGAIFSFRIIPRAEDHEDMEKAPPTYVLWPESGGSLSICPKQEIRR